MHNIICISDWLENKSQKIMSRINHLIDVSDKLHLDGKVNHSEKVDYEIDLLYNKMNVLDDRQTRILSKGYSQ